MHAVRWSAKLAASRWQNCARQLTYSLLLIGLLVHFAQGGYRCWDSVCWLALLSEYLYGQYQQKKQQADHLLRIADDGRCFWQNSDWYCYQAAWLNRYLVVIYLQALTVPLKRTTVIIYQDSLPTANWRDLRRWVLWQQSLGVKR